MKEQDLGGWGSVAVALCLFCAGAGGSVAQAQEELIELPPGVVLPPGMVLPVRGQGEPAGGTNASAEASSPGEKRIQELLKLKFSRTTPAILDALAGQLKGRNAAATNDLESFKERVMVGDWPAVGNFLRTLTNEHARKVYRHLLRELPNSGRSTPEGMPPGQPVMMQPPGQGPANNAGPTLVPGDVMALAVIAPQPLEDEDARLLGRLLGRLLSRGDALEPLLPKLESGVPGLGGVDPADRRRAAELLVAANRVIEAGRFLPSVDSARDQNDFVALDLRARALEALGSRDKEAPILAEAWAVNQMILAATNSAATNREAALRRSFDLMPAIAGSTGTNWLRTSFQDSPAQGLVILSAVSQMVQRGLGDRAVEQRQKNLEFQRQVVDTFLDAADPAQPHWRVALNLLAQGWMQEAIYARQRFQPRRNFGPQYDEFGNMTYFEPYQQNFYDPNQLPPISVEQAAASGPGDRWLAQLDDSLRFAVRSLLADLHLKAEQTDEALINIEALAAGQPRAAKDLANEFLRVWARTRNPVQQPRNQSYGQYGPVWYGPGSPYGNQGTGVSLTRAMQVRNIRELSGLLRRLEALNLPRLDGDALVGAFAAAHSPAEVFRVADIEAVFGPLADIKLDTLAGLAQTMRERLAGQWRQPRVQQEVKTRRTDKQIDAEILRGYEVVLGLIQDGLRRNPDHWPLNLARAATYFDLAEFQYGKKVDLAIYIGKREEAFQGFERAANLYAAALPSLEEKEQSPKVFQQWFNANLGASDLAYVTRQQEPGTNQLQRIRSGLLGLPAGASERHLAAFARSLGQSADSLKPELKPRYLRAGLKIVGDHKDAADARKLVAYYDDLLQEIEFVTRVDGDAAIGHSEPFGVFVSLRHTAEVEREAGGFGRYLRDQKKTSYGSYYSPSGQQQRNFLEEFEKQVREKLTDKFDIKAITFLDEKVQSRGSGRAGWRETPLAFLLLQAKDGSVDQLPALHMDLDFMDQRGPVVLPVESQITLLDARSERGGPRHLASPEITQILDDREISAGRLSLEIKATGKGLVPDLPALVRTNFAGLTIEEFSDHGLAVSQIDTEGDEVAPVCERNWLLKFRVADDAPASLAFHFPEATMAGAKMSFKRYADADLVEVKPEVALAGVALRPRPWWHWAIAVILALSACGGGIWWSRRRKPAVVGGRPAYALPEPTTPFTVISLLRRMQADTALRWAESDRTELGRTLHGLERYFFDRERDGDPAPDLAGIGRHWVKLAGNGR